MTVPLEAGLAHALRTLLGRHHAGGEWAQLRRPDRIAEGVVCQIRLDGYLYTLTRERRDAPVDPLSPRQREIVRLVAHGLSNRDIADELQISPWTVSTHLRRAFEKLNAANRAEAVARALLQGG